MIVHFVRHTEKLADPRVWKPWLDANPQIIYYVVVAHKASVVNELVRSLDFNHGRMFLVADPEMDLHLVFHAARNARMFGVSGRGEVRFDHKISDGAKAPALIAVATKGLT